MKTTIKLAAASTTSLLVALSISGTAFAWHPKGTIIKSVTDTTSGNMAISDANDDASAITVNTGDTLTYTVVVTNDGDEAADGKNDMAKTTLTDTLPDGIELVSDPSQRTIKEDLGTIAPGKSVTKTYNVKVTSTKDGDKITNKACFTGDSTNNDNAQSGCDVAIIKVHVPETPTPVTPKPTTPTPTTPVVSGAGASTPVALPSTGASTLLAPMAGLLVAVAAYAGRIKFLARSNA